MGWAELVSSVPEYRQWLDGYPGHLRRQTDDHDGDLASVFVVIGSSVNECLAPLSEFTPEAGMFR